MSTAGRQAEPPTRFVAVCDVLGFRSLLEDQGLAWVNDRYRALTTDVEQVFKWEARTVQFSDTIVAYSAPVGPVQFDTQHLHETHRADAFVRYVSLLIAMGIEYDLPLRGGVACGPVIINRTRQLFLGQPIVDAYRVEQSQDWMGAAMHDSCFEHFKPGEPLHQFFTTVPYEVPVKSRPEVSGLEWALDWPGDVSPDGIALLKKRVTGSRGTRFERRWRNTDAFFRTHFEHITRRNEP